MPAKLPPPKPTSIQEALWQIQNPTSLEVLAKLLRNVVVNPGEEKYRRIKLSNPKIKTSIQEVKGGLETLKAMGWVQDPEDEDMLFVPKGLQLSMAEVHTLSKIL